MVFLNMTGRRSKDSKDFATRFADKDMRSERVPSVLVIAVVLRTHRNAVALWSILECLEAQVNQVVLSSSEEHNLFMLEKLANEARNHLRLNVTLLTSRNDR